MQIAHTGFAHYSWGMTQTPPPNQSAARDTLINAIRRLRWAPAEMAVYLGIPPVDVLDMLHGAKPTPQSVSSKLLFAISIAPDGDGFVPPTQAKQRLEELANSVGEQQQRPLSRFQSAIEYALLTTFSIGVLGGMFVAVKWFYDVTVWLYERLWNTSLVIVGPIALILVAAIVFWFRCKCRATYGLSEIGLALVVGINQLPKHALANIPAEFDKSTFVLGLVVGSVYFIVRGLDNVRQGWKDDWIIKTIRKVGRRPRGSSSDPNEANAVTRDIRDPSRGS